jgi:branched-chain amino acid transport system ATP-binding protein
MCTALAIENLDVRYGLIPAVSGLTLQVESGSLTVLLGTNGAGKSTTLNAVAGLIRPARGSIRLSGVEIAGKPAHQIARRGLALVPEGRLVVAPLTVQENLELSSFARGRRRTAAIDEVWDLFPRLAERRDQKAGLMSGGEQQMLAIGRALMTAPTMLLLDEPSMGLAPALVDIVFSAIMKIHDSGVTILLVEQNAAIALPLCDFAYLIHRGDVVASGTASKLIDEPELIARHLGLDPAAVDASLSG